MNGYLSAMICKFDALMISGWNGLHGMDPWATNEDVKWLVKINNVAYCFLYEYPNSDRQQDSPLCGPLKNCVSLDSNDLI